MVKYMAVAVAMAVAVSGCGAVAVAGLTKRFFNHIQKDVLINVWVYVSFQSPQYFDIFASTFESLSQSTEVWIISTAASTYIHT